MSDTMKELGIEVTDANGEMKPLEELLRHLRDRFSNLDEAQKASAAATIFGKEAMSGMLAVINASDADFDNLSQSINNSNGAAERMAKTMQDNLKGSVTNLKSAIEEAGIKIFEVLEPALQRTVDKAQQAVDWFNNLDKGTQNLIVTVGGLAAAIGPLLVVGGTLISGVGSMLMQIPKLIALMTAISGPMLAVTAVVAGLSAAYMLLREKADEVLVAEELLAKQNLKSAEAQQENLDQAKANQEALTESITATRNYAETIDNLIDKYDGLNQKSKLTNDEFLEYLTLQTEMEHTKLPSRLDEINIRMEELRKKSGLSKEEFDNLLASNKELSEYFPEAGAKVDEYGNAVMETTAKLREMSRVELERQQTENYNKLIEGLSEANRLIEQYEQNQIRIYELEDSLNQKTSERVKTEEQIRDIVGQQEANNQRILELKDEMEGKSILEKARLNEQVYELKIQNGELDRKKDKLDKNLGSIEETLEVSQKEYDKLKEINGETDKIIDGNRNNFDMLKKVYEVQFDIVLEKGKENEAIDKAITKRSEEIKKLEEKLKREGDSNGKIQEQINLLKNENDQLQNAKRELDSISGALDQHNRKQDNINRVQKMTNEELRRQKIAQDEGNSSADVFIRKLKEQEIKAKDITKELKKDVDKKINIKESETPQQFNNRWNKPISKVINFLTGKKPEAYAKGTNFHAGGHAFIGEEGPELVNMNGRMQLLNFGLYDLPRGSKVHTAEETQGILQGANRSVRSGLSASRAEAAQNITIQPSPIVLDGRVIGEATFNIVDNKLGSKQSLNLYTRGG